MRLGLIFFDQLLKAFPDYTASIEAKFKDKALTVNDVIEAVTYYDSLVAEGNDSVNHAKRDTAKYKL